MGLQVGDAVLPLLLFENRIKKKLKELCKRGIVHKDYAPSHWMQGGRQENKQVMGVDPAIPRDL